MRGVSARITVYCRQPEVRLDPGALRREIDQADLMTLAEDFDLPEGETAAVRAIRPYLRVEQVGKIVEVCWKPDGRPIQIEVISGDTVAGWITELTEQVLPPASTPGAERVLGHLRQTRSIVLLQMDPADSVHMGGVLGTVLSFGIAGQADGLVRFYHRDWVAPDRRWETIWTT